MDDKIKMMMPPKNATVSRVDSQTPVYVSFNVNTQCKVKLTEHGEGLLIKRNSVAWKYNFDKETQTLRTELWNVMNIFGDQLYNGTVKLPFVGNKIELET